MEGLPEIGYMTRDALTTCEDYNCIVDVFSTTKTIVPIYMILAGTGPN